MFDEIDCVMCVAYLHVSRVPAVTKYRCTYHAHIRQAS